MKFLLLTTILLVFIGCFSSTKTIENKNESDTQSKSFSYSNYRDLDNGFSIDFPTGWDTTIIDPRIKFMAKEAKSDITDNFGEVLNVTVFPNNGLSLSQMADENINLAKQHYDNLVVSKQEIKNTNGVDCVIISFTHERKGIVYLNYTTFFDNGELLFTLTQTTEKDKKEKYEPVFMKIINSFNWLKK